MSLTPEGSRLSRSIKRAQRWMTLAQKGIPAHEKREIRIEALAAIQGRQSHYTDPYIPRGANKYLTQKLRLEAEIKFRERMWFDGHEVELASLLWKKENKADRYGEFFDIDDADV